MDSNKARLPLEAAEAAEFARWRDALRDDGAGGHRLPADFADRLVAAVGGNEPSASRAFWTFGRPSFFKIAASLAVLLGFSVAMFNLAAAFDDRTQGGGDFAAKTGVVCSGRDFESRCEQMAKWLGRERSQKAAAEFLANVFAASGV